MNRMTETVGMDVADRVLRLPVCSWRTPLLAPENMYRAFPNTARTHGRPHHCVQSD